MASTGTTAVEKLQYGILREYSLNEGSSAAQDPGEYDWGTGDVGAYTYTNIAKDGDFMVYDTAADFTAKKAAASAQGKTVIGVLVGAPQGKAGQTREGRVYHFGNWDVVRCMVSGAVAVGDKVSLGVVHAAAPHGFKVAADNTNGFGYALNSTAADGEFLALLMKPGTFAQA